MIELTDSAAQAIRTAIDNAASPAQGLRIMVEAGGCAGYKYMMGLVEQGEDGDVVVERDGVKVFVDQNSAQALMGVTVDFTIGLEGAGFTFSNPNATSSCSCGKSFG